jgi:AsmA protein
MAGARIGRTALKVVLGLVALFVVLVVALVLLLQSDAVTGRVKDFVVPKASAAIGRELTVKDAKLRLFPGPRVALTGVAVAGRPGEPPLAELDALEVSLELWPLVRSMGNDVRVSGIRIVKPVVNLIRAQDGTWNYEGLGGAAPKEERPAPSSPGERTVVVSHVSIEDGSVRYLDRAAPRGEAKVALSRIDLSADNVGVGQPLQAKLAAAIAAAEQNFKAEIGVDRLPAGVAALGPGRYPQLTGSLALVGLDLAKLRAFLPAGVTGMMTGGRVDADAKLATREETYLVDGQGKLGAVRLRGEPAEGGFALHATLKPATGALHAVVDKLALKGPGVDLGGNATFDAKPIRLRFAIAGPLLDLGQVLGMLPPSAPKQEGAPVLTAEQRRTVQQVDVGGTIQIDKVVKGPFVLEDFKARTSLERGAFVLHDASARFFGGRVDASGTRVDLAPEVPTWSLQSKLDAVDLGNALQSLAGAAPLLGKLNGSLALDGAGVEWESLRKALTGQGAVNVKEGTLTTADLGGDVLGAVSTGLRALGKGSAAGAVAGAGGKTQLRDLAAQFTVKDGAMALAKPLSFGAPFGAANLGGRIGLDGALGLEGTASIPKEVLTRVVGGGLPLPSALQVPLSLGGTLRSPAVSVNAQQAVAGLAEGAVKGKAQELQNKAEGEARKAAERGLGDVLKRFGR